MVRQIGGLPVRLFDPAFHSGQLFNGAAAMLARTAPSAGAGGHVGMWTATPSSARL